MVREEWSKPWPKQMRPMHVVLQGKRCYRLWRLSTPAEFIRKFTEACAIPIILYCSPAIFPGLLKQKIALLKRSIMLICKVLNLSFSNLTNLACERQIKAFSDFAARILSEYQRPLYEVLSKARSHTPPGAASSCFLRRLLHLGNLLYRHCHGCWLTETLSLTTISISFINVNPPSPLLPHFPNCTNSLKFVQEEDENFTFQVK